MRTRSRTSKAREKQPRDSEEGQSALHSNGDARTSSHEHLPDLKDEEEEEDNSSLGTSEEEVSAVEDGRYNASWTSTSEELSTADNTPTITSTSKQSSMLSTHHTFRRPARRRSPWAVSNLILLATVIAGVLGFSIIQAFLTRQKDPDGCQMSYMRAGYAAFPDFDTEHTRFASKYSLYLYREGGIDEDTRVKGVPVLFIPGNAGSMRQVRSLAAEAAVHFHDVLQPDMDSLSNGKRPLDWFTVDFNEDLAAFHGQTLLDQAEYLNEAIQYILKLYHNPNRSIRDTNLPDPTSVILVGHSMGGIVARTMLTLPNHQTNSVNTIITLAAPHARPPVSFDAEIISTYSRVNDFWRNAYSQKWANDNPLWHVTLISIAGGGLDTTVPSDYMTTASLIPPTHGFTVFTSTMPNVWTGMDHLAMVWCDQLRKSIVRALYDVIDAERPVQTRPRAERMSSFKKWFLTGLEEIAEHSLSQKEPRILLTLEDNSNNFIPTGERLVLRQLGESGKPTAHLMPVPPQDTQERKRFTLLTDQHIGGATGSDQLEVMFCSVFPLQSGQSSAGFPVTIDLSGDATGPTRLACRNTGADVIDLPASTSTSKHPYDQAAPFSYLQFDLEQMAEYQFVAVIDKNSDGRPGWVLAEFTSKIDTERQLSEPLYSLMASSMTRISFYHRSLMTELKIPSLQSSLLAFKLSLNKVPCDDDIQLFSPLVRQYISDPYESKFFVNVKEAEISMHGVAPYLPPSMRAKSEADGLTLQIWSDPTCNSTMEVSLKVDIIGSMGKLWMRYRTAFTAFPLLIVALVLRKQFKTYDDTGIFMSFSDGLDKCLRSSIPVLFLSLTLFGISHPTFDASALLPSFFTSHSVGAESVLDYTKNDLLLGSQDPFFWFLVPMFGIISIGICVLLNYAALFLTYISAVAYSSILKLVGSVNPAFVVSSLRRRLIVTSVLIILVWTFIPYQFLFIVLCIAQLATCVRALSLARESFTNAGHVDFYNYTHSIFLLMLWILPINLPTLVVWIHNLTVHWLTPFSSHHNVLSILPFVLLVETLSTGKMIPRLASSTPPFSSSSSPISNHKQPTPPPSLPSTTTPTSRKLLQRLAHHLTSILFFAMAAYAAIYGVTYAYLLHHIVNAIAAWLMIVYYASGQEGGLRGVARLLESGEGTQHTEDNTRDARRTARGREYAGVGVKEKE